MSYNPYAGSTDNSVTQNRMQHPQPQHSVNYLNQPQYQQQQQQQHQQQQQNQQYQQYQQQQQTHQQYQQQYNNYPQHQGGFQDQAQPQQQLFNNAYSQIFNDPRAAITLQAGEGAFRAGTHFVEENFQKIVGGKAINYYFKVSNSYVLNKLLLILFPYRNNNWSRSFRNGDSNSPEFNNGIPAYAYPLEDKNAPDLYIPLMGIVTYILTLALLSGLKDEFTPQVFGAETSTSLLALFLDFGLLKLGLYLLNIASNNWDLIAYIGYKFVPIIIILLVKNISSSRMFNWFVYLYLVSAFAFFELRAIRFNLFGGITNPAQNLNTKTMKNTNYFLFLYAFLFQGFIFWWLSK